MGDFVICRCEEVTRNVIIEAIRDGAHTINNVKRLTRAGMGLCQGKTCCLLVSRLLSRELDIPMKEIEPYSIRPPVRPLKFSVMAESEKQGTG